MAFKNVFLILFVTCLMAYATTATRSTYELNNMNKPGYGLEARLEASGNQVTECFKAIQELNRSCSNVTLQFFFTGEADIAPCCRVIDTATSKCSWANTLPFFGYTAQESNLLKAYCDAISPAVSPVSA